jgi:hypothetical protein
MSEDFRNSGDVGLDMDAGIIGLSPGAPSPLPDDAERGRAGIARKGRRAIAASASTKDAEVGRGRHARKGQSLPALSASPKGAKEGLDRTANLGQPITAPLAPLIDEIRAYHRERCMAMEQRKRIDLGLGSYLRTSLGWRLDLPEKERNRIKTQAARLMAGKETSERFADIISATELAREPFEAIEDRAVEEMTARAEQLPIWATFGEPIKGFGPMSLAVILAEAGDLSNYSNHSKLWKRMGLAVIDGLRQGGLPKGAGADEWIIHAYNRKRRSKVWNIGDALIKGNKDGRYRTAYLTRKAYEVARDPEIKPIKAHRRAQRYMEKRLLRDLWKAWRAGSGLAEKPKQDMPANSSEAIAA